MAETTLYPSSPVLIQAGRVLAPGERVGAYEIVSLLGAGGMGEVYRAADHRLGRAAALKVLRATVDAPELLFLEAQAMAKLSHPNVVTVYDVGTHEGNAYVAMELVAGETLRSWMATRRGWRETVRVFAAAGRGLAAAHAAGIVHRDFKPDNVLIGADGRVRVGDFGLASAAAVDKRGEPAEDLGALTTVRFAAAIAGTPAYMAPEQHLGQSVDARADQFAFCVALHEALFGARPFAGDRYDELRENVLAGKQAPPPPGVRVPRSLRAAIARGLALDKAARFPSMDALVAAIEHDPGARRRRVVIGAALLGSTALAAFGVLRPGREALPPCTGAPERIAAVWSGGRKDAVRDAFLATGRPHALATTARVLVAMDRYAAGWSAMHRQACEATAVAHDQSPALLDLRMRCLEARLGGLDALAGVFARAPDPTVLDRAVAAVAELDRLDRCADAAALTAALPPPDDPVLAARVEALAPRLDAVLALERAGKSAEALTQARPLAEEARALPYPPIQARAFAAAGIIGNAAGQFEYSERLLREALLAAARAHDDDTAADVWPPLLFNVGWSRGRVDEALALAPAAEMAVARAGDRPVERASLLGNVGKALLRADRYPEAESWLRRGLAVLHDDGDRDRAGEANLLMALGVALREEGRLDEAEPAAQRALTIETELAGPDHMRVARALNGVALIAAERGQFDDAIAAYRRALDICMRSLGAQQTPCAKFHANIGAALLELGRLDEALAAYRTAAAMHEQAGRPDPLTAADLDGNLGETLVRLGRVDEALPYLERARASFEKELGAEHLNVAEVLDNTGHAEVARRRFAAARTLEERALAIREQKAGAEHVLAADSHMSLGDLALAEGKTAEALAQYRRALAIREARRGAESFYVGAPLVGVGAALLALGRAAEAVDALERGLAVRERTGAGADVVAAARFLLARALRKARRDPQRARDLARAARATYAADGLRGAAPLRVVDAWLTAP